MNIRFLPFIALFSALILSFSPGSPEGQSPLIPIEPEPIRRVSVASDGTQANDYSWEPSISTDGRYITFMSAATNLVPGDTNNYEDIFVHDRFTGQTERVSISANGVQGNGSSLSPSISADGRYVAFVSAADNLVPEDRNSMADTFLHDRLTGDITRVSIASDGTEGDNSSFGTAAAISADGRYIAFCSYAGNLVPGGDLNGGPNPDVYLHDRETAETTRISVASDGTQANDWSCKPSISSNGRFIAFDSFATNLAPEDPNSNLDVFIHDQLTGNTSLISRAYGNQVANGESQSPSISADGRYVAYVSTADNLVAEDINGNWDIFVHDRLSGQNTLASIASNGTQGDNASIHAALSADGKYVLFDSVASNLVSDDTNGVMDLFMHNLLTHETIRVSMAFDGAEGNDSSRFPTIASHGCAMAFASNANNLVPNDTNNFQAIFVRIGTCSWQTFLPGVWNR